MSKVYFDSEEEYRKIIADTIALIWSEDKPHYAVGIDYKKSTENAKEQGYIKKSAVEEAEEIYNNLNLYDVASKMSHAHYTLIKQHEAIQELKEQLNEKNTQSGS